MQAPFTVAPGPDAPVEPKDQWSDPNVCLCCRTRIKPGTRHWWQAGTCRVEVDDGRPPRGLVAQRTVHLRIPPIAERREVLECGRCQGSGKKWPSTNPDGTIDRTCPRCKGSGRVDQHGNPVEA